MAFFRAQYETTSNKDHFLAMRKALGTDKNFYKYWKTPGGVYMDTSNINFDVLCPVFVVEQF